MQIRSNQLDDNSNPPEKGVFRAALRKQYKNSRSFRWATRFLSVLLFIAFFSNFIANDKPIYCKINNVHSFPILKNFLVNTGVSKWPPHLLNMDWKKANYQKVLLAPIPYAATSIDLENGNYKSPFDDQNVKSNRYWHWLGTDKLGRDVLAGMIAGARTAMLVGVIAMFIATLIGMFFGTIGGYFGDNKLKLSYAKLLMYPIAFLLAIFYGFISRQYVLSEGNTIVELVKSIGIGIIVFVLFYLIAKILERIPFFKKEWAVPADILIMRLIEVLNSVPLLLFLLVILAIIRQPSILYVMLFIGLLRWTGIARFVRAELLRIRSLEYIEATEALGFNQLRIIWKHAIPNALTPVMITIAFGIASAILLEASLSFLGIGVSREQVTWGSMLSYARLNFSAWWLAIFPGLAIFFTVTIFNVIGEGLTRAMKK